MSKTVFQNGDILPPWYLNALSNHRHDGRDNDASAPQIDITHHTYGTLDGGRVGTHSHTIRHMPLPNIGGWVRLGRFTGVEIDTNTSVPEGWLVTLSVALIRDLNTPLVSPITIECNYINAAGFKFPIRPDGIIMCPIYTVVQPSSNSSNTVTLNGRATLNSTPPANDSLCATLTIEVDGLQEYPTSFSSYIVGFSMTYRAR